jgi:RHS repeat-associated protein
MESNYDRRKDTVRLTEFDIYGSKRIGTLDTIMLMKKPSVGFGSLDSLRTYYLEGQKQYELTNHLGNVMVTVSDKKIPVDTASLGYAQYYLPNIISAQDYYPFGMVEPGRSYLLTGDSSYRYGMNGDMKDIEIYGTGNAYTTDFRELDPRLGRWWARDPVFFPWLSPYAAFNNNPIYYSDPSGLSGEGPAGEAPADDGASDEGTTTPPPLNSNSGSTTTTTETWHTDKEVGSVSFTPGQSPSSTSKSEGSSSGSSSDRWGSTGMFPVHQEANERAIQKMINCGACELSGVNKTALDAMNAATVDADQDQSGANAYKHAMRNGDNGQTVEEAMKLADAFVRQQFMLAKEFLKEGRMIAAYYYFGVGLHTLQDATSPAHGGFQPWSSNEDASGWWNHVKQEGFYPGMNSNLQKVTDQYLKWFESTSTTLPAENLFLNIKADPSQWIIPPDLPGDLHIEIIK